MVSNQVSLTNIYIYIYISGKIDRYVTVDYGHAPTFAAVDGNCNHDRNESKFVCNKINVAMKLAAYVARRQFCSHKTYLPPLPTPPPHLPLP